MRCHSLDGTEDIGSLVPSLMQHGEVPGFPFLGARVDQLLQKLFTSAKVCQRQHRANRLAQPLTHLIERLLDLSHHKPAACEAFGQQGPPRQERCPILFPGFRVAGGLAEVHMRAENADEEFLPIVRLQGKQGLGAGLRSVLFQLQFPPNTLLLGFFTAFLLQFQSFLVDAQHGLTHPTAEVEGVTGRGAVAQRGPGKDLEFL